MGYSAYVICRNSVVRDEMHEFIKNATPWCVMLNPKEKTKYYHYTDGPVVGDDIAYGARPLALGYNFSTQGESSVYLWSLLRFMAQRAGRNKTIRGVKGKFTVYDGHEFFQVKDCDENGFAPELHPWWTVRMLLGQQKVQRLIKKEMARLGELWSKQQGAMTP